MGNNYFKIQTGNYSEIQVRIGLVIEYFVPIQYFTNWIEKSFRNDETIISSISVTDIFFDVYLGKWNYIAIPKVKTWSYFLTIP